jgi:hypothetical protein
MKRTLLILSVLALTFSAKKGNAQLINADFETWTNDALVPSAMNPNTGNGSTGWWDYNVYNYAAIGGSPISLLRSDTAHSGTYSARIQTVVYSPTSWNIYKSIGVPFIGHNYSDTLGILFNGNLNETTATYKPGIPCTKKITSFSFWYQYAPKGVDTAECRVSIVKNRSIVAGGSFKTSTATGSTWQQTTINLTYLDTFTPDTMYVLFSASSLDSKPKPGSVFWVDDASIALPLGIQELKSSNEWVLSPNPSTGIFTLRMNNGMMNNGACQLSVLNALGEKIYATQFNDVQTEIDLSNAPPGIYFLQIISQGSTSTRKVLITR